ncbi:GTP cyclohydrolase FolE2 [Flagellatimonas centrodinii]|uniref:GTP cyclohydrolase FolE2 n=1 Tax=Flagellatimonas centrodinii TaxID=2806210 RepID=UPI001FEF778B|nr:GTP cyclohydrolase FolE2 [Flagellatimonas centrodinii]ULQ45296.1 GTP cyclohydrolase FolE2 [Flagellatimonas centrodinii]
MNHIDHPSPLPDTQSLADPRGLAVTRAGVSGLSLPARVIDVDQSHCDTVVRFDLAVGVPAAQRGTHMSRLVEAAHALAQPLDLGHLDSAVRHLLRRMDADSGHIHCRFPWFVSKSAPASGRHSLLELAVEAWVHVHEAGRMPVCQLRVHVPVTTLCPCSKAISQYGAHNQRSQVSVTLRAAQLPSVAQLASLVDEQASCGVYAVLKREDEKAVTEAAYDNPKFAEDLVRDLYLSLQRKLDPQYLSVATENHESIHNHAAYAVIDQVHVPMGHLREDLRDGVL